MVNLSDVFVEYQANTAVRFKSGTSTSRHYWAVFVRFCKATKADKLSVEQLQKQGRKLLLSFMQTVPLKSRRLALAALQTVWLNGLGIGWPLDTKRDFGKTLPPTGHRETPPNTDVEPWSKAVAHEDKPMVKALVTCLLQYGWRPVNQLAQLKWRNVKWQGSHIVALVADGQREGFKTNAWIVAYAFPSVASSLEAWHEASPLTKPDDLIFNVEGHQMTDRSFRTMLSRFEREHNVKHMLSVLFRHWVKTTARPLSDPAIAALQGHAVHNDGSMRNVYDRPRQEDILSEQQQKLPNGPLGLAFDLVEVKVEPGHAEVVSAFEDLKAGRITQSRFVDRVMSALLKVKTAEASFIVPR